MWTTVVQGFDMFWHTAISQPPKSQPALLGIDHQVRFHHWQPVAIDAILLRPPPGQHPGVLPQDTARGEEGANEEAQTHVHALHQTHRSLEAFVSDGKK